jgi:hypothetical protein
MTSVPDLSDSGPVPEDPQDLLAALPSISEEPLGTMTVIQRLLTIRAESPHKLDSLFRNGVPIEPTSSLVGALLSFLAPDLPLPSERRLVRRQQQQVLESQTHWPDLASVRGDAYVLCFDGDPDLGLPRQLYADSRNRELISWPSFSQFLARLIQLTTGGEVANVVGERSIVENALTTVLYELFKNTEDHATHEVDGADVERSVRGIYAQFYSGAEVKATKPKDIVHKSPSRAFLENTLEPKPNRPSNQQSSTRHRPTGILEISVFDSGPGMAARWSNRNMEGESSANQMAYVLECFKKGRTSTASPSRGFGLWKVLRSIEEVQGFLSVRTNGIRAYRRFDHDVYRGATQIRNVGERAVPKEMLLDWRMGLSPRPTLYRPIRGTVVSVLLPIAT